MSIPSNRVLSRIVEQVDRSDWPPLESEVRFSTDGTAWIRIFEARFDARYATPIHFWVHALREDLAAGARREDLRGAAGYALCRNQSSDEWRAEIGAMSSAPPASGRAKLGRASMSKEVRVYRMLSSACRRSSVAVLDDGWMAHFWGHGPGATWRRDASG